MGRRVGVMVTWSPSSLRAISTIVEVGLGLIIVSLVMGTASSLSSSSSTTRAAKSIASSYPNVLGARQLGQSDLVVSEACLGTMTFGVQNNRDDAFAQLDLARSCGINFVDTAELYPVPLFAPEWRAGATEQILGDYLQTIGPAQRDKLVIATKVAGYFANSPIVPARRAILAGKAATAGGAINGGDHDVASSTSNDCRHDAASIKQACEASLARLKTDRIDLLQLHWPDRYVPLFGQMNFDYSSMREDAISIEETASAMRDLIQEGKVRAIGLSNETPFGLCEWVRVTEQLGIRDKLASIQNSYSLLDRRFDSDLAEVSAHHQIGLLPWSVLAGGLLSGKYRNGAQPAGSRFVQYPTYMKRWSPVSASESTLQAVDAYAEIAANHPAAGGGRPMSLAQLAIEFCRTRPFVSQRGAVIVGATTVEQLKENLAPFTNGNSNDSGLHPDVLKAIDQVHMRCRDPSCSL